MSAGSKRDPIWFYFNEKIEVGKKGSRAVCKKCGKEIEGLVARLKNHFSICESTNEDVDDPQQSSERKFHMFVFNYSMKIIKI